MILKPKAFIAGKNRLSGSHIFFIRSKKQNYREMGLLSLPNLAIYIKKAEFSGLTA